MVTMPNVERADWRPPACPATAVTATNLTMGTITQQK
jgi:hypothetical protein